MHTLSVSLQTALAPVQEQIRLLNEAVARLEDQLTDLAEHPVAAAPSTPLTRGSRAPAPRPDDDAPGCLVPECEAGVLAKQLCETHYRIMRRTVAAGETFDPGRQRPARARVSTRACGEEGCEDAHYAKGLCRRHYMATRSRIRAAERQGGSMEVVTHDEELATETPAPAAQITRAFSSHEEPVNPHTPAALGGNGVGQVGVGSSWFREGVAATSSSREALPTAEVVSRVVTQYRGGLDRVAEVLGRNKRTLMELLDRLDLMPFVTRIREAERQRIESATLRERLDDLLFREKLLDDLGCLKDVDERARFEVKMRCADLAKNSESIEEAVQRLARDLELDDAGMKRLIWRYDLRRYLRGLKLKSEGVPVRSR